VGLVLREDEIGFVGRLDTGLCGLLTRDERDLLGNWVLER